MLNKLRLFHNIRKFYKLFGEDIGVSTDCFKYRNMNTDFCLLETQYHIYNELQALEDCFCEEAYDTEAWLNKLNNQIIDFRDRPRRKPITLFSILLICVTLFTACSQEEQLHSQPESQAQPKAHTRYTAFGRYYTDGTVITDDGNEWSYSTDLISDKTPYNNMPIWIGFDDNGTTDITDDIILGCVFDIYTAIYDDLETNLSESFELEREGNNIRLKEVK